MEVCNETLSNVEQFHFGTAKHVQGLPSNCANYGAIVTAGWMTLSAHFGGIRLCPLVITTIANELFIQENYNLQISGYLL